MVSAHVTWDLSSYFVSPPAAASGFSGEMGCHLNRRLLTLASILKEIPVQEGGWGLAASSTQLVATRMLAFCHRGVDSGPVVSSPC